jgi:hypothetical protein
MKKVISLIGMAVIATALSGCGGQVVPGQICTPYPGDRIDCAGGGFVEWPFKSAGAMKSAFDASLVSLDLSSSNVSLVSNSGYFTVEIELEDGSTVANSFPWVRSGSELIASNPSAVNAWVQPYLVDAEEVHVDLDYQMDMTSGTNLVVAEIDYAGSTQAGSSYSYYNNGGGCGLGSCQPY